MEFIYQKESNLDKGNNFTIKTSKKNNVEKKKFISENENLILSLGLKLKDEDITKWPDCNKVEALSKLANKTKKKKIIKFKSKSGSDITKEDQCFY